MQGGQQTDQQRRFYRMMQQAMMASRPYAKRSGPALEKETLLGLVLRLGLPPENSTVNEPFRNATRKTINDVRKSTSGLRQQLRVYHEACHGFIKSLVTAGETARSSVLTWVADALDVNAGANAFRPDRTKCSHAQTLLNLNVILLKLCEPFVTQPEKAKMIDAGFVSCPEAHRGVFRTTGDDAVTRFSESNNVPELVLGQQLQQYHPKNAFIPQVYFFLALALLLGLNF